MMWMRAMVLVLTLALAGAAATAASAQEATPAAEDLAFEPLFSTTLDGLPPAPIPVTEARITFEPGASLSMTANPGPALHFVETGGFTVRMEGAGTLTAAADGTPQPVSVGTEFEIAAGDLLAIPADTPFEVRNDGAAPAEAVIVEYFTRSPGTAFPDGIALDPLVTGEMTTLPPGPATVDLFRLTFPVGAAIPPSENSGTALVYVEEGTVGYTLGAGGEVVLAGTPGAAPEPQAATPGAELLLEAGDGVVDQRGTVSGVRNAGDTPLVVLSLSHHPLDESATPTG